MVISTEDISQLRCIDDMFKKHPFVSGIDRHFDCANFRNGQPDGQVLA